MPPPLDEDVPSSESSELNNQIETQAATPSEIRAEILATTTVSADSVPAKTKEGGPVKKRKRKRTLCGLSRKKLEKKKKILRTSASKLKSLQVVNRIGSVTALQVACQNGDAERVKAFIQEGLTDEAILRKDSCGDTALHDSINNGHSDCFMLLMETLQTPLTRELSIELLKLCDRDISVIRDLLSRKVFQAFDFDDTIGDNNVRVKIDDEQIHLSESDKLQDDIPQAASRLHEEATCGLCCIGKSVNKKAVIVDGKNKNRMGHNGSSFMANSHVLNPNIDVTERGVICMKCFRLMESTSQKVLELREMFASSRIFTERRPNRSQSPAVTDCPKALSSSPSFQPKRAKPESWEENPACTESGKKKSNGHTQTDELQFRGQDSHLQDDIMSSVLKHKISPYAQLTEQEKHQRVRKCMKKISKLVVQICEEEDVPFEEIDNAFRKEYSSSNQLQNDLEENTMIFESPMESPDGQNLHNEEVESKKSVKIESEIKQEDQEFLINPGGFICPTCSAHFMFEKYFIEHISGHHRGEHDRNGSSAYRY